MNGVAPPNYTQIPNEILDKMAEMSPAEFKVLIAICRKTFGWHKDRDVISLTQLEELTGLSRTAVQGGVMAAIKRGLLERTKAGTQSFCYRLLVASDYQSTEATSSGKLPVPVVSDYQELVVSDYTQNKQLKKLKESGGGGAKSNGHAAAAEEYTDNQKTIGRLVKAGLTVKQARTAISLQAFPAELLDRLDVWAGGIRKQGKNPGAILCGYTNAGHLPDDLPARAPPPRDEYVYVELPNGKMKKVLKEQAR